MPLDHVFFAFNAFILQSMWSKFLKFLPHILTLVYCKIIWLDMHKIGGSKYIALCTRNGSFEHCLIKKYLLTLGIKIERYISFLVIQFLFQSMPRSKNYATISLKWEKLGIKKIHENF